MFNQVVTPARFELATRTLKVYCSKPTELRSHFFVVSGGFEPPTFIVSGCYSKPTELRDESRVDRTRTCNMSSSQMRRLSQLVYYSISAENSAYYSFSKRGLRPFRPPLFICRSGRIRTCKFTTRDLFYRQASTPITQHSVCLGIVWGSNP